MTPLIILDPGFLGRKENTLIFENKNIKKYYPIKNFDSIFCFNEVVLNSKLLSFLSKELIPIFFFSFKDNYVGCFYPFKAKWFSGKILLYQVSHYFDKDKRIYLAKEFVRSSIHNMRKVIIKRKNLKQKLLVDIINNLNYANTINDLLLLEAKARRIYYSCFDDFIYNNDFHFGSRSFHPPLNEVNALISFGNSILYGVVLSEIYRTQLDPQISYLHEPEDNRYSLQLDLADIFKPLLVDRLIFSLLNKKVMKKEHFHKIDQGYYLNRSGKRLFLSHFFSYLLNTVNINNVSVSYRQLIRRECWKLINYFKGLEDYKGFKMWW